MSETVTNEIIKTLLRGSRRAPLDGLHETGDAWSLGSSVRIDKRYPLFSDGFERDLLPSSHFYKRWFELAEHGQRGWAIVFQVFPPGTLPWPKAEYFAGWVPPERGDEADRWIEFLNNEIRDRLQRAMLVSAPSPVATGSSGGGEASPPRRTILRVVKVFRELGAGADAPSIVDARGTRPSAHKAEVVAYLRGGTVHTFTMRISDDVFDPRASAGRASLVTDGVYAWPQFLAYYVDKYDVSLPADFEAHMRQRGWAIPDKVDLSTVALPGVDAAQQSADKEPHGPKDVGS